MTRQTRTRRRREPANGPTRALSCFFLRYRERRSRKGRDHGTWLALLRQRWERRAAHDLMAAFGQLQAHDTRYALLRLLHVAVEGLAPGREPAAVIDHVGVLEANLSGCATGVSTAHEALQRSVRGMQN